MPRRMKPSREAQVTGYYSRAIKRIIKVVLWLFVLFAVVMAIVWVVPRIWAFVFG